jgi:glycosyltransferase involved in cell wall biosynthesis
LSSSPKISAILTTRNRAELLPQVLAGLAGQTLGRESFEIVAVDDGSSDSTPQILQDAAAHLPIRMFRQNHAGLAAAKNLGVFASRAPLVVFLDDDDVAEEGLLEAHVRAHQRHPGPEVAVLGYTRLAPRIEKLPLMHHVTQVGCQLFSYGWMKAGASMGYKEFWGGRTSCKRGWLIRHGVFNPVFKFGCEDIELGWRLSAFGLRVVYEPAAVATMIRSLSFEDFCRRSERQGRSQWRFSQLHRATQVRNYCEIDDGLSMWESNAARFKQLVRWTAKLDHLANVRVELGRPIERDFQTAIDDAYRAAFKLSRAKGISDAARVAPVGPLCA